MSEEALSPTSQSSDQKPEKRATPQPASKTNHNKPTNQLDNQKLFIIIGAVVVLIIAVLLFFFLSSSKPREIVVNEPLPYIFNKQFKSELNTFISQPRHKDVLIVYGPSGMGKTRGLNLYATELNSKEYLTFDFDFKSISQYANDDDFVLYLQSVITTSMKLLDTRSARTQDIIESVKLVEALTSIERPIKESKQVCKDVLFQRIAQALFCITESIKTSPEIALNALFEAFNALEPLSPVVIVHDISHLLKSKSETIRGIVGTFWRICDSFSSDYRSLPIIIELPDEISLIQLSTKETVHAFRVGEFDLETARQELVNEQMFSLSDFQFAIEKFGGHGRNIAQFRDKLLEGTSPQNVYRLLMKQQKDRVVTSILLDASKEEVKQRSAFLKQLSSKQSMPIQPNLPFVDHFLQWKVVSLLNMTHCSLPDKLTEKVVVDVVNSKFRN
ncbi:hypothetical protein TRFO_12670 [Tritrichomonas foetus]|uniref:ATPase domain-containing protein n=1 Tax=Tritrichomonas foetus TaxID=1144522 RepID=A0A1J4L5C9_9EUKA|nr:hypothetical protein TRFO_12670 [Tritrichomonas foetus]|eukprot:OHT17141.1 hypothetical protein TRFO_12670 [Tritrichomonas foetus]